MSDEKRYYVDERAGCIAVRDRTKTNPDYFGLQPDTKGVVFFWMGDLDDDREWVIDAAVIQAANDLCDRLNSGRNDG